MSKLEKVTDFGFGIGIGGKWITSNGLFLETNFGVGRNMFVKDNPQENFYREYKIFPRFGINIGYRF